MPSIRNKARSRFDFFITSIGLDGCRRRSCHRRHREPRLVGCLRIALDLSQARMTADGRDFMHGASGLGQARPQLDAERGIVLEYFDVDAMPGDPLDPLEPLS